MSMRDKMMEFMMGGMSKEDKEEMMINMMDKFLADMTREDKKKMMQEMMPKMMEGIDMMEMMPKMMGKIGFEKSGHMMGMMSSMMGDNKDMEATMVPKMMMEMMPHCLGTILPSIPEKTRINFMLKLLTTIIEQGLCGLSQEAKEGFLEKVIKKLKV